jgi:hypothetical protein
MNVGTATALTGRCLCCALCQPTLAVCDDAMRQGSFWDLPYCRLFVGVRNFRLELEIEKFRVSSCAVSCSIRIVELSIGRAHSL